MKKNYFLICILITFFSYSQQVVKKITTTQVSILALGNGSALPNACGINNIDIGNSDNWGNVTIYTSTNSIVSKSETIAVFNSLTNENVGSSTLVWDANTQSKTVFTLPDPNISLSFFSKRGRGDCDGDIGIEGIITVWDLPFTQTDGSAILNGTKLRFTSPSLTDLTTGGTLVATKDLWFEWQNSDWLSLNVRPDGSIPPTIVDWGTFLNIPEYLESKSLTIYPNPVIDNFSLLVKENSIENFNFKIFDMTSRIVKSGNSKFSTVINIENLKSGNYIIKLETENGIFFNQKFVKK